MTILVTGAAGYIGSHTCSALLKQGYQVVALDNLCSGFKEAVPQGCDFQFADIRDTEHLKFILTKKPVDGIIHFAAKTVVGDSIKNPTEYYDINFNGTLSLAKVAESLKIQHFVFSSTAAVYSGEKSGFVSEKSSTNPLTPYGQSKLMSEQLLLDCHKAFNLRISLLRYFNVAGGSPGFDNGQRTVNATHLVKICAEAAAGKRTSVEVYGTDYETHDGTGVRDYIHVCDLADLHILALKEIKVSQVPLLLNCGYGKGHSVFDVIKAMEKVSGKKIKIKNSPRRKGDLECVVADTAKLQSTFNWSPQYNNLELICKTAFEWEKKLP
ncbi:MAG: UDP-glucose 4-epimerase GalE [Bdellovibrionales bacterium]